MYAKQLQRLCWGEIDVSSSRFQQANNNKWESLPTQTDKQNAETHKQTDTRVPLHCQEMFPPETLEAEIWRVTSQSICLDRTRFNNERKKLSQTWFQVIFTVLMCEPEFTSVKFNLMFDTSRQLTSIWQLIRAFHHQSDYLLCLIFNVDISHFCFPVKSSNCQENVRTGLFQQIQ